MAADWLKIKSEYVSGNVSYRELSEKYGVSQSVIRKRAAAEKWTGTKTEQRNKIRTKVEQKVAERTAEMEADRIVRMLSLTDEFVNKIERAIQEVDRVYATNKKKTKVVEYNDPCAIGKPTKETIFEEEEVVAVSSIVDRKGLQQIAAAMKTAWEIIGSDANGNGEDNKGGVVMIPEVGGIDV